MRGNQTSRLARPAPLSRGEFGEALPDSVLKFSVVGIQSHGLTGEIFVSRRQIEKECFRRRMDRARRLNPATACPLHRVSQRISSRSFDHEAD